MGLPTLDIYEKLFHSFSLLIILWIPRFEEFIFFTNRSITGEQLPILNILSARSMPYLYYRGSLITWEIKEHLVHLNKEITIQLRKCEKLE